MTAISTKRQLASGISVIAIATALTLATPADAQTTSAIEGRAAAGSTVTATDLNTGQTATATVDANGHYIIVGVPPSTYRIQSGTAAQTVVVPIGQTVSVDLAAAAPAAGEIVVVGSRSKDVKTPAVTTNVSRFQIENLPNGDRNFLNFAALAPGVTVSPPTLGGRARQVQAGAIPSDNTNTYIDGLSIKNLVNHGGTLGQNYSSGNPFPASAVDQFNVETQNFKAEYGDAASAVISSVTKTGGNQFHGEIFGEWQPKSFISLNYDDRPGHRNNANPPYRPKPDYNTKYYGGSLGGPIIKNKLSFFLDFEGTNKTFASSNVNVYPSDSIISALPAPEQAYAASARSQYNGTYPLTFNEKLYFGKLTYFATPDDTVNVSGFIRHESNLAVGGGVTTTDASSRVRNNEDRYEAWWTHRGSGWLNELYIARDVAANGTIPNVAGSSYIVTYSGLPGTTPSITNYQLILGGLAFAQDDHQYQTLVKDNVTITRGPHTIKFGGTINFTKLQRLESTNTNGTYFFDANSFTGVASSTPYAASINTAAVLPVTARNKQIALFAQDDWRPDDHLQVSFGLRWDYESNATNENFVTPPDVAAALRAYSGWTAAGINPEDYISNGHNRKPFLGEFQPRLGVSYDLHGDRDIVLFAGAGRYYDRSLFINSAIETIKNYYESNPTLFASQVGPLPMDPDALRALAGRQHGEVDLLNNHTKIPYSDEVDAGVRKRFGKVNTSITFSYIKSNNLFSFVVGNRFPNGTYANGFQNQILVYKGIPYTAGLYYGGSAVFDPAAALGAGYQNFFIGNNDSKASYAAMYLQADKPYTEQSGYGFSGALTISTARSNNPMNMAQSFETDTPIVGEQGWGPILGLERWRFVGTGTVKIPFDIRLSTVVTLSSGPSYGGFLGGVPATVSSVGGYLTEFGVYRPHGIAYKNVDINAAKIFKMPWNPDQQLTVYFEALNAFDFVNRQYTMWVSGSQNYGGPGPTFKPDYGAGTASQGRNFKVGAKFTF